VIPLKTMHCRSLLAFILATTLAGPAATAVDVEFNVNFPITRLAVDSPPKTTEKLQYVGNRAPLAPTAMVKLPIGSIAPKGWLRKQLELDAAGMAGHLPEVSTWCKFEGNAWTDPAGNGKNGWEEVPYWIKGFGDLGYVLKDERIKAEAKRWIDAIIATQAPDGWFGPKSGRTSLKGKPDMWAPMPVLNALQSYYEVTSDERVVELMTRYFKFQLAVPEADFITGYWDKMRTGDNLESVYWLYNRTGDAFLLELADKLHRHAAGWTKGVPNWHNVNLAQGFREPAEWSMQSKNPADFAATVNVYDTVMGTYGQVPGGGFGGDENARPGFVDPRQGFETCGMVEFLHSFQMLGKISGDGLWADRAEEIAFNSYPAALTPDHKALHYLTAPNQVQLDKNNKAPGIENGGTMFSYSPTGVYRCCQHNHSMGWPYYAEELWHATGDGGLCATLYAASDVTAKVAGGKTVKIEETTDYPFGDTIELKVTADAPAQFPLYLRVPRWCEGAKVTVNGQAQGAEAKPLSYLVIDREWKSGDTVTLSLPMKVGVRTWERNKNAVSVDYGPLTFSLQIGEKWVKYGNSEQWPEHEVYPTTAWNYGLVLAGSPAESFEVVKKPGPVSDQPFTKETAPISLKAKAKKIPGWTTDKRGLLRTLEQSPVKSGEPVETVTLIPMGAARLRISAFPVIGEGEGAHEWPSAASPTAAGLAGKAAASASHTNGSDTVDAVNDGELPKSSNDQSVSRHTFWDHKGTSEWLQYDWKESHQLSAASVYWFDDTGRGECRVPASWKLLYRDGGAWKPVEATAAYGTKRDTFNRVAFKPVKTTALRLEVQLQPNVSGGVLEWQVE
jgi:hypothetical protein